MPVSVETYERVALEDANGHWELVCGRLRQKPPMANAHAAPLYRLNARLVRRLDEEQFIVSMNNARLRVTGGRYYIPDLCVLPRAYLDAALRDRPRQLEVYDGPVPLVVEVWSPSTGDYDIADKLPGYQARGDAEIWRLHPYDKTLTRWLRQPDGSYTESTLSEGEISPAALPGVSIRLAELFT